MPSPARRWKKGNSGRRTDGRVDGRGALEGRAPSRPPCLVSGHDGAWPSSDTSGGRRMRGRHVRRTPIGGPTGTHRRGGSTPCCRAPRRRRASFRAPPYCALPAPGFAPGWYVRPFQGLDNSSDDGYNRRRAQGGCGLAVAGEWVCGGSRLGEALNCIHRRARRLPSGGSCALSAESEKAPLVRPTSVSDETKPVPGACRMD